MTSKEHTKSLVRAELKRRAPVRRGQAYEEHQAAVKEHDEHRQHFAATKTTMKTADFLSPGRDILWTDLHCCA
jgi:hypothetical protein